MDCEKLGLWWRDRLMVAMRQPLDTCYVVALSQAVCLYG